MSRLDWSAETTATFLKNFHSTDLGRCIKHNLTRGFRPDVSCYLPQTVIDFHLSAFVDSGAAKLGTAKWDAQSDFLFIGHNGINWVTPYGDGVTYGMKKLVTDCSKKSGNTTQKAECTLMALGIPTMGTTMFNDPSYSESNRVIMVEVYGHATHELNLRMASGNEEGANDDWNPGGYTSDDGGKTVGLREAVMDTIWKGEYCWTPISTQHGEFCYPDCKIECSSDLEECKNTACTTSGGTPKTLIPVQEILIVGLAATNIVMMIIVVIICARWRATAKNKDERTMPIVMDTQPC